jgi:hypothetical protein
MEFNSIIKLVDLQRALNFRTVSVPSDEPLCIATLMDLDARYISATLDAEERMTRVWELISRAKEGLPSKMIFYLDEALSTPGWRWAPKSLLGSSAGDSIWSFDHRALRFNDMIFPEESDYSNFGIPTPMGLKVKLPGCRLKPQPLVPELPLDPWEGFIPNEDEILLQDNVTGRWMRIIDWYRSTKIVAWTTEERMAYDNKVNKPLARSILTGKCALLYDQEQAHDVGTRTCIMVQVDELDEAQRVDPSLNLGEGESALMARGRRPVILSPLTEADERMKNTLKGLACRVAADKVTQDLIKIDRGDELARKDGLSALRKRMEEVMAEAWISDPELEQSVKDLIGDDMAEYMWNYLPKSFSCDIYMHEMPDGQIWFVD